MGVKIHVTAVNDLEKLVVDVTTNESTPMETEVCSKALLAMLAAVGVRQDVTVMVNGNNMTDELWRTVQRCARTVEPMAGGVK